MSQGNQVDVTEIVESVERKEPRISANRNPDVKELWEIYRVLAPRFAADLNGNIRDIALAKSAALMVLQSLAEAGDAQ